MMQAEAIDEPAPEIEPAWDACSELVCVAGKGQGPVISESDLCELAGSPDLPPVCITAPSIFAPCLFPPGTQASPVCHVEEVEPLLLPETICRCFERSGVACHWIAQPLLLEAVLSAVDHNNVRALCRLAPMAYELVQHDFSARVQLVRAFRHAVLQQRSIPQVMISAGLIDVNAPAIDYMRPLEIAAVAGFMSLALFITESEDFGPTDEAAFLQLMSAIKTCQSMPHSKQHVALAYALYDVLATRATGAKPAGNAAVLASWFCLNAMTPNQGSEMSKKRLRLEPSANNRRLARRIHGTHK